jgi:hypothetical protein
VIAWGALAQRYAQRVALQIIIILFEKRVFFNLAKPGNPGFDSGFARVFDSKKQSFAFGKTFPGSVKIKN